MIIHQAMIEQQEAEYKRNAYKQTAGYKLAKGIDNGNHAITSAISYAEYHTNKLNGQRPFDRPYGNAERTIYRKDTRTSDVQTYSKKTAREWIEQGAQVFVYEQARTLKTVWNSKKSTRKELAGIRIEYKSTHRGDALK